MSASPSSPRKLALVPLVAATYFMVSGGPYGLEELVHKTGFAAALVVLLVTPLVWSLPTALMVGELGSALPDNGGYYAWVKRALGPFWGFQEAWLSLAASVFDMAIYPTLFTLYLGRLVPALGSGVPALLVGVAMIGGCAVLNIRGASAVGGASVGMTLVLLTPFAALALVSLTHIGALAPAAAPNEAPTAPRLDLVGGMLVAMWNYMGWDSASTVAGEVDEPQRNYPIAMLATVTLVALTYLVPVAAVGLTGLDPSAWDTGSWVDAARAIGGPALGVTVVVGGMVCAFGMFNALVLSYSRLPLALAEDGYLPSVFARLHPKTGAPWVAICALAVAWAACLRLGFERLVELDVMLYGLSLLLEFAALFALRLREPNLPRPFRVPGGLWGAALIGAGPLALVAVALWHGRTEAAGTSWSAFQLGAFITVAGLIAYAAASRFARRARFAVDRAA